MTELEEIAQSYINIDEETGKKSSRVFTTPVVKNEAGSLALSMLTSEELAILDGMTTIESLGTYEEMFADEEAHNRYKSVYPYHIPIEYVDEEGVTQSYMRPKKIGEFAT